MARRKISGSRAIVTGASSGIGRALALELARRGARLVVTARREDRLASLAAEIQSLGRQVHTVAGDVTDPALRQRLLATAVAEFGGLDLLVNNAGSGALGPFDAADESRLRHVMEVNFFAPAELTRAALPLLRQGRRPMVVNVGSILGHRAVPGKSEYCASKFALHGLSQALRAELIGAGIDVLLVSPGATESEFFQAAIDGTHGAAPFAARRKMPALTVARQAVRAMERGRHEIILSAGGRLLVWIDRLCAPLADWLCARYG